MADLGQAYVQIVPSARGIGAGIEKELNGGAGDAGKAAGMSIGGNLVSTIRNVIVAAGIGKVVGDAISAGADLEQQIGGVETLFAVPEEIKKVNGEILANTGKSAAEIEAIWQEPINTVLSNAQNAYKEAGMSQNEYMETINGFAAALNQSTGDVMRSADVGQMAVVDMSDNANKMGTSIDAIKAAYSGFAKQNYTMLDNLKLGYGGTAAEMARLVNDAGLLNEAVDAKSIKDVGLDVIFESIHKVQEEMGIAGTTAKEATSTFSGSLGMLEASWQNVLAAMTLGEGLDGALSGLGESLAAFIPNALRLLGNLASQIPSLLGGIFTSLGPQLIPMAQEMISGLAAGFATAGPQMLTAAQGMIASLQTAIETQLPTLLQNGVQMVTNLVSGITSGESQLLTSVGTIVSGLVTAFVTAAPMLLSAGAQIIGQLLSGIATAIPALITTAATIIPQLTAPLIAGAPEFLAQGVNFLINLVSGLISAIPSVLSAILQIIAQMIAAFASAMPQLITTGFQLLGKVIAGIINAIPQIPAAIGQVTRSIKEIFGKFDWAKIGADILIGIKDGILGAVDAVVSAAKGAGEAIFEGIKGFFKIGSPSKLMADEVGKWIPEGIAVGITSHITPVNEAISGAMTAMQSGLQRGLSSINPVIYADSADREREPVPVEVTCVMEGDMQGLFRQVRSYNTQRTRATGYNALAARS